MQTRGLQLGLSLLSSISAITLLAACAEQPGDQLTVDGPAPVVDDDRSRSRAGALTVGIQSTQDGDQGLCSGDLAADTFRYGLCVCGDLSEAGALRTSSFVGAPGDTDGEGGGVGVNGDFTTAGSAEIGGTLAVGGDAEIVGDIEIAGELRVAQRFIGAGAGAIGQDAYVQGDVDVVGDFNVGGVLHLTESPGFSGLFLDAEDVVVEDFVIDAPCGCDLAEDVDAFIAQAEADNDNDLQGVPSDVLIVGAEHLTLEPGRYWFEGIETAGLLEITVTGPTAVYVAGGVALAGALDVDLDGPDASLDLFIGGDLQAAGHLEIGSLEDPGRVRLYLASDADLEVAGHLDFATALYAPNARLRVAGDAEIVGAVVVGEVVNAGRLVVRYDADLQDSDDACDPGLEPPPEEPAPDEPAPDEPAPEEPAPEEPADGECDDFQDCPDPQQCVGGLCIFIDG